MSLEQELKFECSDFSRLRQALVENEARFLHRIFEKNQVFDTRERQLRKKDMLLRLRQGASTVLCLKSKPRDCQEAGIKTWEETQTKVQDAASLHTIFCALGYEVAFCYEKVREKWKTETCTVCLDQVPFGKYVEIEGTPQDVWNVARTLGLDTYPWTTKSYHTLHQEWREKRGLRPEESFVFDHEERAIIQQELCESTIRNP